MPPEPSFLGTGWAFPPSFGAGGREVEMASAAEDIHQSLEILLGTTPGERVLREDFGCDLHGVAFEEMDQRFVNEVTRLVEESIVYYEPRIVLNGLDVEIGDQAAGRILVRIDYTIRGANARFNMVYPFYRDEALVAP